MWGVAHGQGKRERDYNVLNAQRGHCTPYKETLDNSAVQIHLVNMFAPPEEKAPYESITCIYYTAIAKA